MNDDFYVTLPSQSNKAEFPQNKANYFKIRLPQPLRLHGSGWKVGLSSISIPDAKVGIYNLLKEEEFLFTMQWIMQVPTQHGGFNRRQGTPICTRDAIQGLDSIVDGVSFMKAVINFFEQRRILNNNGPTLGGQYVTRDGKRLYVKFRWEGQDLIMDNTEVYTALVKSPLFSIHQTLALKMGWLWKRNDGTIVLGPNLRQEFMNDHIPDLKKTVHDLQDISGSPVFWKVQNEHFTMSTTCNWRFLNLNNAFQNVVGEHSRSLFVYSDVGGTNVVGNQVTDLLREINFQRQAKGINYFEPLHIQYIPVRKEVVDIIETQVAETSGELSNFGEGNTILTLHFKREL